MSEGPTLLDVNLLVALTWPQHIHHHRAHEWLASQDRVWATTPLTESALVRVSMNERVVGRPVSAHEALGLLAALRQQADHRFLEDRSSLAEPAIVLRRISGHNQITDAHLINLAAGHGACLATFDSGLLDMLDPSDRRHVELIAI